jgi:hypothetical protein
LIGAVAYPQVFALFESIATFLPLLFLSVIFPPAWFRDKYVALSAGLVFLAFPWFLLAYLFDLTIRAWGLQQYLPWVFLFTLDE